MPFFRKKPKPSPVDDEEEVSSEALENDDEQQNEDEQDEEQSEEVVQRPVQVVRRQPLPQPEAKPTFSKEEIGDLIDGHIARLAQLWQVYRGMQ